MSQKQPRFKLLLAEIDPNWLTFFRILIDGQVKYLVIEAGINSAETMCSGPSLASIYQSCPMEIGTMD